MAEETLTEALANLNDENIDKAALPEQRRVEEDTSDESTFIELSEEDVNSIDPITDDVVQEEFDPKPMPENEELTEAERKSKTAQDRINKSVAQAKEYQRRELQALQYAKSLLEKNQELEGKLTHSQSTAAEENLKVQKSYGVEFENRVEAQAEGAKKALKAAMDSGDQDGLVEAQQLLARAEADRTALNQYTQQLEEYEEQLETYNTQQAEAQVESPAQLQQVPQQPQYQEPSDKAKQWANDNEWFGKDRIMTNVAMALHEEIASTGIDLESDEYYSELNNRMRLELPHKFENAVNDRKNVQTVVSTTRTTGNGRNQNDRRIELSPSEQQLAKKLGVPFKEYAKQKMRLQRS
tara:strand:- start:533 stop:1591 length:1059 start_codon:yes stop_codon:yes gene_type:complete